MNGDSMAWCRRARIRFLVTWDAAIAVVARSAAYLCFSAGACTAVSAQPLAECHVPGIRNDVQCGVLSRPLDPTRGDGPAIDIHYVVVPALARRKLPDPVFLIAGGPGQSAIGVAPQTLGLFSRLNNRRDIVFVDQRGTGQSAPLECADAKRETLAEQSDPDQQFKLLMQCKAALLKLPYIKTAGDLGFFTTTIAMQDLDAVRRELGAERINIVAVSYGTRAALEYMRQFPNSVRRSVLDAVVPPDMVLPASFSTDNQASLDALFNACEKEASCSKAYPNLRSDWSALLNSLPRPAATTHPLGGEPERFVLNRDMVLGAVRGALYSPSIAAALPAAITQAAAGSFDALVGVSALFASRRGIQPAMGMHFSVVCAEDVPLLDKSSDAPGKDFGVAYATLYRRVCADWPRGSVPTDFYTVPTSHTPTLIFSGGIDPAAPPRHGERIARALGPAAQHVVVPNASHGALGIGCVRDVIYRFIDLADDKEATSVDADCVKSVPRPLAFQPIALPKDAP
jgi:pimeloyl-ACP methyl ester carboxylesterase